MAGKIKTLIATACFLFLVPSFCWAYSVTLHEFTGTPAEVEMNIQGDGTNSITFNVQVIDPDFADIRGVFFNLVPFVGDITVTGEDVNSYLVDEDGVAPSNWDVNPAGPFDVGVEIGLQGIGGDKGDIYSTSFVVSSSTGVINLGDFFGVRLMSVGDTADDREGSSKLVTNTPIPEPTTMLLLGIGLIGVAGLRKKLKKI